MSKDRKNSTGTDSMTSSERSSHRSSYEEDYSPHYSNGQKKSSGGSQGGGGSQGKKVKKSKKKHTFGKFLAVLQGILSLVVLGLLLYLDVLPDKYVIVVAALMLILWIFAYFSQYTRKTHMAGKVESVILSIVLAFASYYLVSTNIFLGDVTSSSIKVDSIVIVVLDDDPAETLADAADYTFGIQSTIDRTNVDSTIEQINENLGQEITTQEYDGLYEQVSALYSGEVGAIIYNEAFNENITEDFETFEEDIRILENVKIETEVAVDASDLEVTEEPFTIYITGIDTYGDISTTGRSDVNILVTVNPSTKQILLTTTPRDYYVEFPGVTNGELDKLTHAGIYGVDCSVSTLEELYGIDIDYYAKVNFTSVVELVDLLGGITVYSEYAFTASSADYSFVEGYNDLDGEAALAFVRERKNLEGGDNQRGKNQMAVITALIQKAVSPSILKNYSSILSTLSGNFETNMDTEDITALVKMQLSDEAEWNIVSQSVTGTDSTDYCYSSPGQLLYVMVPDEESVAEASAQIQAVLDGEILEEGTSSAGD